MSIFSSIGGFFKKFFTQAPTWSEQASSILTLVGPLINTVVMLSAGDAAGTEAASIISEIKADTVALSQFIQQAHTGTDVSSHIGAVLDAITNNLSVLLTAGHIKNADLLKKLNLIVPLIAAELKAIATLLPKAPAA